MRSNNYIKEEKVKNTALIAKTHPTEYLLHKYWARKPHNILSSYIKKFFNSECLLVDPFAGSGVFLAEAKKQNISSIGFDINPIAALLSEVTTNPPNVNETKLQLNNLINYTKDKYSNLYTINDKKIRYLTHVIITKCPHCGEEQSVQTATKNKASYFCKKCNTKLSFNYENMIKTQIIKITDENNNEYSIDNNAALLNEQEILSNNASFIDCFNNDLVTNRRILAFPGMKHSNLFTPRAYMILSDLFIQANNVKDESHRKTINLFLTSCVAQCSRLIPYRNNLSTGGPAWTMPGFWIAPIHLETNPIIHMEARYKKFIKGLDALNDNYKNTCASAKIFNIPMQVGFSELEDESVSGIFFDPPYGDNVPYLEFSAIWNNFIVNDINYKDEIIVSDRKTFKSNWQKYKEDINNAIALFSRKLKPSGKIIMTFNNLNPKAWEIVINAFNKNNLFCIDVNYQIPAVVSTKSQMASNTSYVGDFYCVFEKKYQIKSNNINLYDLTNIAKKILLSRENKVPKNLMYRTLILTILKQNLNCTLFSLLDEAIMPVASADKEYFYLRDECKDINNSLNIKSLKEILHDLAKKHLINGKQSINKFYEIVMEETEQIGLPPLQEVKFLLNGVVLFEKEFCYLQSLLNH